MRGSPAVFLFRDQKLYEYSNAAHLSLKAEQILAYLSGDNYTEKSKVVSEDSDQIIEFELGISGSFVDRI